jgi:hypothetical protein
MSIVINSLTPFNPTAAPGNTLTFVVNANDTNFLQLSYQWQTSTDGINYSSANLSNNTTEVFTTNTLGQSSNGLYVRVVISNGIAQETVRSNEYLGIGDRVITIANSPIILTNVTFSDNYPISTTLQLGQTLTYTISSALQGLDIAANDTSLQFQWQQSTNSGSNWTNVISGGNVVITQSTIPFPFDEQNYYKQTTLSVSNIDFDFNLRLYRLIITYPGASNTPLVTTPTVVFINPTINITKQPGEGNDTISSFCFKSQLPSSDGKIKLEVNASSTSQRSISYAWQFTLNTTDWIGVQELINSFNAIYKPNTSSNSSILELEKMIYYDVLGFRCVMNGTVGESETISNTHYVFMRDVQVTPSTSASPINIVEDKYGNVSNRNLFPETIQRANVLSTLNIARNTGLNGNKTLIFEKLLPGSSEWIEESDSSSIFELNSLINYTLSPSLVSTPYEKELFTSPLRFDIDNGVRYRLKIISSSLFNLSGNVKSLLPYYSSEILINVFRIAYITAQPQESRSFVGTTAAFSIEAIPSSGTTVTYQWQYNTTDSSTGWINITNSSTFTGATTNLLSYNNIPSNPTFKFYRCVVSVPNQLSSVTSSVAFLSPRRDLFVSVSNINDVFTSEFQIVTFTANAVSLSTNTVLYQWQKSINYNPSSPNSAIWTNIVGATNNELIFNSVSVSDTAYYRCRVTSFGGEVRFTNAARLDVQPVNITITKNIPLTSVFLESQGGGTTFETQAFPTIGNEISYQWQIKQPSDLDFQNFTVGFQNSPSDTRFFTPPAFSRDLNGSIIRCKITSSLVPFDVFTNQCVITVNRRFYYFADSSIKAVVSGQLLNLDLNPTVTGGVPAYQWETSLNGGSSWSDVPSATSSNLTSSVVNGQVFRCEITLDNCNQHQYSRNNSVIVATVSSVAYTVTVTISVVAATTKPIYYSQQLEKTGAAIGTVVCVPKPPNYAYNPAANTDDLPQWNISTSGHVDSFSPSFQPSSTVTSGSVYNANKPSWSNSSYISPKWRLEADRFKGFLELRGQWLKKTDFPELYRVIGDAYGNTPGNDGLFRLPNPYGKKLFGTGNVNNNSGSVSVEPLWGPDGLSGGSKEVPGSIGGYWSYSKQTQLPPGSPNQAGAEDGIAGVQNAPTFSFGNFRTAGFDEVFAILQPSFSGRVIYDIQETVPTITRVPTHSHVGVSVGNETYPVVLTGGCNITGGNTRPSAIVPDFPETRANEGSVDDGPAYVTNPGRVHTHGITLNGTEEPGNGFAANHGEGTGSGGGAASLPGQEFSMASAGMTIGTTELRLTNQSRPIFDDALRFYFRNNEEIPIQTAYFRLRYMIKAY